MRGRMLGGKGAAREEVKSTCPYLGLAHDQFSHLPESSAEHRCYLYMQRERIDRSHQQRFCLTTSYPSCPWLMVSAGAAGTGQNSRPWQRFGEAVRESFDQLERVTMRNRWPRALAMLLLFLVQMVATGAVEGWRIARPVLESLLAHLNVAMRSGVGRTRRFIQTQAAHRRRSREADPGARSQPMVGPPGASIATAGGEPAPVEPAVGLLSTADGAIVQEPVIAPRPGPRDPLAGPAIKWECASCFSYNQPAATFCQRCGRLSARIEEDLLAREEFFTLDGLKELAKGDEEAAHRHFTLATQANPQSEFAWRWRSRTSLSVQDVISCLEQMLEAIPGNAEAKADLDLARERRDREDSLAIARAAALAAEKAPTGPSLLQRAVVVARRLALELASIPAFILGLLWLGKPIVDAIALLSLHGVESVMPVFDFPTLTVSLPAALVEPLLPSTFAVFDVVPFVVAVFYILLAFAVADGSNGSRYVAILGGIASLAVTRYVGANGASFFVAAVFLVGLAVIGKGGPREDARNPTLVATRVA